MRAVVQRVSCCRVTVDGDIVGEIGAGLLVLLGVNKADTEAAADYLVEKIVGLRIFEDAEGKMNLSVQDSGGAVLVVSQLHSMAMCGGASVRRLTQRRGQKKPNDSMNTL